MKILIFILVCFVFYACSTQTITYTIVLNANKDSCYSLSNMANRKIEIIKNSFSDTTALGYAILPPRFTGACNYYGINKYVKGGYDPDIDFKLLPPASSFCIQLYKRRAVDGEIIIRYSKID